MSDAAGLILAGVAVMGFMAWGRFKGERRIKNYSSVVEAGYADQENNRRFNRS